MKLYDYEGAPSPRRVRIFIAEKGIEIPTVQVDLAAKAQHPEVFMAPGKAPSHFFQGSSFQTVTGAGDKSCVNPFDRLADDGDTAFVPDTSVHHNKSIGTINNPVLRTVWTHTALLRAMIRPYLPQTFRDAIFLHATRDLKQVAMDADIRATLHALFREDIERLQDLLDRDLSSWLSNDCP